jgi:hypothetical protein
MGGFRVPALSPTARSIFARLLGSSRGGCETEPQRGGDLREMLSRARVRPSVKRTRACRRPPVQVDAW